MNLFKIDTLKENNTAILTDDDISLSYNQIYEMGKILTENIEQRTLVFCLCKNNIASFIGILHS